MKDSLFPRQIGQASPHTKPKTIFELMRCSDHALNDDLYTIDLHPRDCADCRLKETQEIYDKPFCGTTLPTKGEFIMMQTITKSFSSTQFLDQVENWSIWIDIVGAKQRNRTKRLGIRLVALFVN